MEKFGLNIIQCLFPLLFLLHLFKVLILPGEICNISSPRQLNMSTLTVNGSLTELDIKVGHCIFCFSLLEYIDLSIMIPVVGEINSPNLWAHRY